nr:MAG: hypothetical protein [Bacteriophage sp.]
MMKVLTHNIRQEREDQRDRSAQLFMWCIVVSMHQDDGIGASRLLRACNETAAVYSEIFRGARAGRVVAPLAVYSTAKYDETMTAARKRASVMLGL